jgi:hypothetical protein
MRTSERRRTSAVLEPPRQSSGQPLDAVTRGYFEPLLGHDFSRVRIHADSAQPSAVGAAALTVGDEMSFAPGWFDPVSQRGRRLLAHELTHVVQHDRFGVGAGDGRAAIADRGSDSEREAEDAADDLTSGCAVAVKAAPTAAVAPGVLDWIEDKVSDVGSFIGDAASSVGSAVSDAASSAWDFSKDVGSTIYGGMKTAAGGIHSATEWATNGIDWLEDKASSGAHWLADKAEGIPVLEQLASGGAWLVDTSTQLTGGALKGATSLAGGLLSMAADPVDTAVGLERMAEHVSIPGVPNPLKALHELYNVAAGDESWGELANNTFNPVASMEQDASFWKQVGGGLVGQYSKDWEKGKYADVLGHAGFDIASLFFGAGEAGAAGKVGEVAKLGEAADVAKLGEAADVAKLADVSGAAKAADAADLAKASDAADLSKAGGAPQKTGMFAPGDLRGVEPASPELLEAIKRHGRDIQIAKPGSEEMRFLDYFNAEANVGGEDMMSIILRENPSKAGVLEEFLHGTQHKLGIIKELGVQGAEVHVKDFMIRHAKLLGLSAEDVERLTILREREQEILRQMMERKK